MTSALSLLPAEHRGVLDSVVRFFLGHPGAVGGCVSGSVARGAADEYSDIDVAIFFADHQTRTARSRSSGGRHPRAANGFVGSSKRSERSSAACLPAPGLRSRGWPEQKLRPPLFLDDSSSTAPRREPSEGEGARTGEVWHVAREGVAVSHDKSGFGRWLDEVFRKDMYERYEFTLKACEPVAGRSFLDVGCGNGLYSVELGRRGAGTVVGLDIAEGMLERCRTAAAGAGVDDRCTFIHSDLLNYEPDTKFDVSFGIGLFDYISDPLPVLTKMHAVTSGTAIMAFPRLGTWRAPFARSA